MDRTCLTVHEISELRETIREECFRLPVDGPIDWVTLSGGPLDGLCVPIPFKHARAAQIGWRSEISCGCFRLSYARDPQEGVWRFHRLESCEGEGNS